MMRGSSMGIPPYWPIILLITWGFLFIKRRPVYPLIQLIKLYIKITWGLGCIRTIATPLDRRKATRKITWGLGRIRTIATPLDRLKAKRKLLRGQRECCTSTTKTQAPAEHSSKYCLGALCFSKNKEPTLVIGYQARLGSQVYSPKTPGYPAFFK